MKLQLETVTDKSDRSFSMMFNPRLSDLFFWHFHPEFELVYIEAESGTRHVGDHISTFFKRDLVLIGSNIPHLNFDYGITTPYRKVVIHFKKSFVEESLHDIPELKDICRLFELSKHGIAFNEDRSKYIGDILFSMEKMNAFERYVHLLRLMKILAQEEDLIQLHDHPFDIVYSDREQGRLRAIYSFVDNNYHSKIELEQVASISNMSKEAFCRYFRKTTRYTFVEFLNRYRISQSKRLLMSGQSISDACFQSGFESLSYHNRVFKKVTGENPREFRKRYF